MSRITRIEIDDSAIAPATPEMEQERRVAIFDLIEENTFEPAGHPGGPYHLFLSLMDRKLVFSIKTEAGEDVAVHILSLTPLQRTIKDYFMICESYYEAIRSSTPSQIEAIDMGRRGLHDEAAGILAERLANKVEVDFDTARRLFTLIYALHWKG